LSTKVVTQEVRHVGSSCRELGEALAGVEELVLAVEVLAARMGWFDCSGALHAMRVELRAWGSDVTYAALEEEEARRGQLRLGGESIGRRHDAPLEDLPF
jgi:dienelactone hydrolase